MWRRLLLLGILASAGGDEVYDCIVIGLGASGLAALTRLTEKGHKVVGLEAMERIGGRVDTQQFGDGVVEFGAEWIHGEDGNPTFELARQNNVSILDMDWQVHTVTNGGYNQTILTDIFNMAMGAADDADPTDGNYTLGEYTTRKFHEYIATKPGVSENKDLVENFLEALELTLASYDGFDSWNDTTVAGTNQYRECAGSQGWSWHKFGYKTLFDILLHRYNNGTALPVDTRLNTEVRSIDWSEPDLVSVKTKSGQELTAKTAIVTVSVGVLKHIHKDSFNPPLPEEKRKAIEVVPLGVVDKICLYYDTPWWGERDSALFLWTNEDRSKVPPEDWWLTQISGYAVPMGNPHVMTLWITGAGARHMEALDADVVKRKAEWLLDIFYEDLPRAKEMRRSTWFSNPHTRGSYSFRGVAAASFPGAVAALAAPLNRLRFAGEATHELHFSTVHGALLTGWREADAVDKELSQQVAAAAA